MTDKLTFGPVRIEEDIHVEVEVAPGWLDDKDDWEALRRRAEIVAKEIKRHVDGWASVGVRSKSKEVCPFCCNDWEVVEEGDGFNMPPGTPLCCEKAQEAFKATAEGASG
ncbi:hypothetical protein LCGC14_0297740 [marine sediment metagenome]|uniref:Uncharacterized protein n=1 Tax=marine sediment metagenome TaxID=412755 RepID=A0A0F9TR45_9ZZZZ